MKTFELHLLELTLVNARAMTIAVISEINVCSRSTVMEEMGGGGKLDEDRAWIVETMN